MKKKLELTCVVKEVKVDLRNPDHVWVSAVIEELDKKADTPVANWYAPRKQSFYFYDGASDGDNNRVGPVGEAS